MSRPTRLPPAIVYYGDDFTGATDTLATGARAGLRTLLFLRVPTPAQIAAAGPLDCLGIAGAARSMAPGEMRAELASVAALFRRLGARVLHYKTCSTFDSAPEVGSVGVAIDTLRPAVDTPWTAIVGGQPELERYCLFGNLFAAAGSGGEVHRIDRHPTMSRHPVTPMHEADLRLHLAAQGLADVRSLPYPAYAKSAPALRDAFAAALAASPDALLFDVAENAHLQAIGGLLGPQAEAASLLVVGPSSVVQAFAPRFASTPPSPDTVAAARGPVLALAGSLSPVTARQVAAARSFETVWLDPQRLVADARARADAVEVIASLLAQGRHVLACTVRPGAAQASHPGVPARALAQAGGDLLAGVLAAVPLSRVGIAGGDTSSHAVQALDAWGLSYRAPLAPGVALCRLHSESPRLDGLEIALKGGQMGGEDFFERLVHGNV
ncbi:four-carbon acid sugar kinase family protein [Variovorax sp. ZT4R33]|uniref:four-carbon acid sugar kinase family protein n=1 Tax=Variovorax sp. ZT4R33 TaxID=3443743 RepID=UPI003F47680E